MAHQSFLRSLKNRFRWLFLSLSVILLGLATWLFLRPPVKVFAVGTLNLRKLIGRCWVETQGKRQALILVTDDGQSWRVTIQSGKLVCEPVQQLGNAIEVKAGYFDMDEDGYPEFFRAEFDTIWVFKRKESVRGKIGKTRPLPSRFPLPNRSQWIVWAKISVWDDYGYCPTLTFITEPDSKQSRKVVAWVKDSSSGGFLFVLSPDGQRLIPFKSGEWNGCNLWTEVKSVEDLDHDGVCEIITSGRSYDRTSPGHIGIYKWDGQTYRLWWTSPRKGEYVVDAKMCDLDGDGTKEIVAVLHSNGQTRSDALAVYRHEGKCYRKVAQVSARCSNYLGCSSIGFAAKTSHGGIIALDQHTELLFYLYCQRQLKQVGQFRFSYPLRHLLTSSFLVTGSRQSSDLLVSGWWEWKVPISIRQRLPFGVANLLEDLMEKVFGRSHPVTQLVSWDGKNLRFKKRWIGEIEPECVGKTAKGDWFVLRVPSRWVATSRHDVNPSLYRFHLLVGAKGQFREIWVKDIPVQYNTDPSLPNCYPADLDGDGADELILVDTEKGKVQVFKIQ